MSTERETPWPQRLTTERLLLREPIESDREALIRLVTDPEARSYFGGAIGYANRHGLEVSPLGLTWGQWTIAHGATDALIGLITLSYDRGELELSFALLPDHSGHGYAFEACNAIIAFAKNELEAPAIIAVPQSRNKRSVSLLKKLGFTVRRGLSEFGTQQFLMELPLDSPQASAS